MFRQLFLLILFLFISSFSKSQDLWTPKADFVQTLRKGIPTDAKLYTVQPDLLTHSLAAIKAKKKGQLQFPMSDGSIHDFKVEYSPVYGIQTEKDYPDIQTFKIQEINDPGISGRIGISDFGFYGTLTSGSSTYMIRKASASDENLYALYDLDKKLNSTGYYQKATCENPFAESEKNTPVATRSDVKYMRHFRVAISATSNFAQEMQYSTEKIMAKIIEALNLLDHRYNIDFGMQIDLIDSTDRFFNLNPRSDYFYNKTVGLDLLQQNQDFLDSLLSPTKYDLAQVFTGACSDVGGVVWGRACNDENKARGVSCYSDEDYFFTTFKHEMGHQFSGGHTFNSCQGSSQYDPESSYEPGAGSTILSYGANCGEDNVGDRMDFFHSINILEVTSYAASLEGVCGTLDTEPNHIPEITLEFPSGTLSIPKSTPFELLGKATDADGDRILYNWEQFDLGHGETLGTNTTGPLFIVAPPNYAGNYRSFPRLPDILDNVNRIVERLPEVSQQLNFNLIARDQHHTAGAAAIQRFTFDVTDDGPFRLLSPDPVVDTALMAGQDYLLKWDVGGSDKAPINAAFVNIMYSTSNGLIFKDTLLTNTPNDGSELIVLPKSSPKVRFKIKPVDNIFFDISRQYVAVNKATIDGYNMAANQDHYTICSNGSGRISLNTFASGNYSGYLKFSVSDSLPAGITFQFSRDSVKAGESNQLYISADNISPGIYPIQIYCFDRQKTVTRIVTLIITTESRETPQLYSPLPGSDFIADTVNLQWQVNDNNVLKEIQVARNITFSPSSMVLDTTTNAESLQLIENLLPGNTYFWRVRTVGRCGYGNWSTITYFHLNSPDSELRLINKHLDTIYVKKNSEVAITDQQLLSTILDGEGNEVSGEINYTLLSTPIHGQIISADNSTLHLGDKFSQDDIADGLIKYSATEADYTGADSIHLIAETPEGLYYGSFTLPIKIDNLGAVHRNNSIEKLIVYPNPTTDKIRIDIPSQDKESVRVDIFSTTGARLSLPWIISDGFIIVNTSGVPAGFYLVRLNLKNKVLIGNFSRI
jgi:hypothetical protein